MADQTLRGWSVIAEFLACDERTAKRWEQTRHLPVHRIRRTPGEGRANVYALTSELETWLASANPSPEPRQPVEPPQPDASPAPVAIPIGESASTASPLPFRTHWKRFAAPVAVTAFAVAALTVWPSARRSASPSAARGNSANPVRSIPSASPEDARAQELYLHGSYLFEQRTPEALQRARLDFQSAIAASPKYAPAYAGLAKTYALLREYSTFPSAQAYPLARQAALQAISLDPRLADAHTVLGYEQFFWEWDATHAEAEFRLAIALDPNSSLAHHWYGSMLMHQTRFAEALDQLNQAQNLEPDSIGVLGSRAYAIGLSGRRDQAADMVRDILTHVPDSAPLHFTLAQLCLQQPRDIPRYLDQMRRFAELRDSQELVAILNAGDPAYRRRGEQQMWQAMLQTERQIHPGTQSPTYEIVKLETALGMKDAALRDLSTLAQNHDEQMIGIEIDTMLAPLRSDPRFARIASQVGLPPPHAFPTI